MRARRQISAAALASVLASVLGACGLAAVFGGCGLAVQSADLFLLTRTGVGQTLTLLISDGGTVRCNGGKPRSLPGTTLIEARQLATDLDKDAKAKLRIPAAASSVYTYTIRLQNGTISFPDSAGAAHPELARAELLALQVAKGPCA